MEPQEIQNLLTQVEPFSFLEPEVIADIAAKTGVHEFSPSRYVFRQDEPSLDCLFIVACGMVEITVTSDRGVESIIGTRHPGDFFSETVVLSRQNYPASARAREHLTCLSIQRTDLEDLIYRYPDFSSYFNAQLAERMRLMYERFLAEQNHTISASMELPLFRKRVSEVMTTRVVTCRFDDPIETASRLMEKNGVSSIVVTDDEGRPSGMLTEKLLVRHLIIERSCPIETCRAGDIMSGELVSVAPEAFTGQALAALTRHKTKYLLVMDRDRLTGIVTAVDLIKSKNTGNLVLLEDIETRTTIEGLVRVSSRIDVVLEMLLQEGAKIPDILEIMSEYHERLIRAVIRVSETEMARKGWGPPPVEYCWVNMGSDARHEQTLRTDQDNAMIYADPLPGDQDKVDRYFKTLAASVVIGLDRCGFALCKGDVMATNAKWRRSLTGWFDYVDSWSRTWDPEDSLMMTILLDFRPVWGNHGLAGKLWQRIFSVFEQPEKINHMLTAEELKFAVPLNFLGNIRTEKSGPGKNQVNIKTGGLVHLINGMRIFAVNNQISEPSTLGRLSQLEDKKVISERKASLFRAAFETLLMFRIRENLKKVKEGNPPDNYVNPEDLSGSEQVMLKDALSSVAHMQKLIYRRFSQEALNFFK